MRHVADCFDAPRATVPVEEIAASRRAFPGAKISFHLEMICDGLMDVAKLCQSLAAAGLSLKSLKVSETGIAHCVIWDKESADLTRLSGSLGDAVTLIRWITQVDF
jgi:hypothetical protein